MAQMPSHHCPRCGIEITTRQKFCARCGEPLALRLTTDQPTAQNPVLSAQSYTASTPATSVPHYTYKPLSHRPRIGRPGIVLLLLLLLILLGTASYFGLRSAGIIKTTQPTITTTAINDTLNYASVDVTVLNAQQSQSFIDDPNTATDGMLRLQLQAQNKTTVPVTLAYRNIAHVVLPNGKSLTPSYVNADGTVAAGTTKTSTVDFAVPASFKVRQLTLRLGANTEAQEDLTLNGHANTAQYMPKTITPDKQLAYLGLNWTLTSATSQLNLNGQQASKGMRYVIITLKVDSTLSQTAIPGSPYDYAHLQTDNATATPIDTTLPVSFDAGETGKTGTVTFLVPQTTTILTFVLASKDADGFDQTTANIQF